MGQKPDSRERAVVQKILDLMAPIDDSDKVRILRTVATYFDLQVSGNLPAHPTSATTTVTTSRTGREPVFSGHQPISPKDFLRQKDPKTDVERAMCLAYYLAHFKDIPSFKTADIAKMNTEAAQRKFANTAYTINNGATTGYFVGAGGGNKQLSAIGEQYVEALPDRQAARAMMKQRARPRKARVSGRGR